MCGGGWRPLPLPDGTLQQRIAAARRARRYRPCSRTCSCTTRSTVDGPGVPGRPFERYVDDVVVHCGSEDQARVVLDALAGADERGRAAAASGEDPDRLLQGRRGGAAVRAHLVHVPGVQVPRPRGPGEKRTHLDRLRPGDQQGRPKQDQRGIRSWRLHLRTGSRRRTSRGGSTRSCGVDATTTVPSTRRRCIPSWRASTPTCCAGCARNTNGCGDDARHKTRGRGRYGNGRASSLTGPGSPGSPPSGDQNDKSRVTRDCYARFREGRGLRCPRLLDNLVHGSDQQGCPPSRPAVMITDHVPAVRLPPDHVGRRVAASVPGSCAAPRELVWPCAGCSESSARAQSPNESSVLVPVLRNSEELVVMLPGCLASGGSPGLRERA